MNEEMLFVVNLEIGTGVINYSWVPEGCMKVWKDVVEE